ncbi:ADP-ribose pyrophosphatase YjhB, NUDIX family [Streptomyces zhaozhouensis]|uniref:ADP-ribose pyrophosphatase YjhB, NUDIX family n=1 Tax=Streptomyces zhaozhouensis TaxID=1300267 RepID=A0A286E799_9ACTN|nr:NUDIX domain-containing protein [Streptomyces zhaozhouensis]SOD66759.1 ADP-ribose pyrophosphatase YjhB, NUDIX family [Streptomyces zhaozhouensis]
MLTTINRSPIPITFHVLATTQTNHVLMVRGTREDGQEGWVLPHGRVPQGRCIILAAREALLEATGCDRTLSEVLAVSPTTDDAGTLNGLTYVLDGGVLPQLPAREPKEGAGWVPLRELYEPPALYQYAIIATGQRRRLPLLINTDRPEAAFI